MIYRIRVILDVRDDVFRDIEIQGSDTLEDLHEAIVRSFDLDGREMASFYLSDDEWNQGEEITLFDLSDGDKNTKVMSRFRIDEVLTGTHQRLLYAYDFMNIRTFYVEVFSITPPQDGVEYPRVVLSYGSTPQYTDSDMEEIDDPDAIEYDDEDFDDGFSERGDVYKRQASSDHSEKPALTFVSAGFCFSPTLSRSRKKNGSPTVK